MTAPRPGGHTLKIKCPTWEHVEAFYSKKLKAGNLLTAKIPWAARIGEVVTLALELPDELVLALEARVESVGPAADDRKSAVRLEVYGLTEQVRGRLVRLVTDAGPPPATAPPRRVAAPPPGAPGLPVPLPDDAPIDEVIEPLTIPTEAELGAVERGPGAPLLAELARMREGAAHEVLGVRRDPSVEEIRDAYVRLVLRFHPDRHARHRSTALSLIAQEVFIRLNKAYDRLREAAVAAGQAIAAGPSLLPHHGWLAGFDDLGQTPPPKPQPVEATPLPPPPRPATAPAAAARPTAGARAAPAPAADAGHGKVNVNFGGRRAPSAPVAGAPARAAAAPAAAAAAAARPAAPAPAPRAPSAPPPRAASAPLEADALFDEAPAEAGPLDASSLFDGIGGDDHAATALDVGPGATPAERLIAEAEAVLETDPAAARDKLATALRDRPRDRIARAVYHVAQGLVLAGEGKTVEATGQLEQALAHDPSSAPARRALEALKSEHGKKGGLFKRFFTR